MTSPLPPRVARLVQLTLAIGRTDREALKALRREAPAGEPDRGWREALLQAHLFFGIPRMVEAGAVLLEEGGLGAPDADEQEEFAVDRGERLFELLYGERALDVRALLMRISPSLGRVVLEHAYAGVLSRPGLEPAVRELLAVAALGASLLPRQLASHVRGARHAGASAEAIRAALCLGLARHAGPDQLHMISVAEHYLGEHP